MNNPAIKALLLTASALMLVACGESATLQVSQGVGADPALPAPKKTLIPTINIAEATSWPAGTAPTPAAGLQVAAFAEGLDHPRWLYRLPNGDVLVAETNAPPKPEGDKGIRGFFQKIIMSNAGAVTPSANRITLLRDADGDGRAEVRTAFLQGLNSPFGMTLIGDTLYVANADAVVRVPYAPGATSITAAPVKVVDLPGGPRNHHWTKNLVASPDGGRLYASVGSNSNVGENGMNEEDGRAAIWRSSPSPATAASSPRACETRSAWRSSPPPASCGPRSTSGTRSAATSSPIT